MPSVFDDLGLPDPNKSVFDELGLPKPGPAPEAPKASRTISDWALTLGRGAASGLVTAPGQLVTRMGGSSTVRDAGLRLQEAATEAMSPEGKIVDQSPFLSDKPGEIFGPYPVQKALGSIVESAPGMIGLGVAGRPISAGLQAVNAGERVAGAITRAGAPAVVGKAAGTVLETSPYWLGEGVQAGGANAADIGQQIRDPSRTPIEKIARTPAFQQSITESLTANPDWSVEQHIAAAREASAAQAEKQVFDQTTASTGLIGAATGAGAFGVLERKLAGKTPDGFLRSTAKGAGSEALQETAQSGGEQALQNLAGRDYANPDQSLTEGVGEAMALGAITGGVLGGGMAAATPNRAGQTPEDPGMPAPPIDRGPNLPAAPAEPGSLTAAAQTAVDTGAATAVQSASLAQAAQVAQAEGGAKSLDAQARDAEQGPEQGSGVESLSTRTGSVSTETGSQAPAVDPMVEDKITRLTTFAETLDARISGAQRAAEAARRIGDLETAQTQEALAEGMGRNLERVRANLIELQGVPSGTVSAGNVDAAVPAGDAATGAGLPDVGLGDVRGLGAAELPAAGPSGDEAGAAADQTGAVPDQGGAGPVGPFTSREEARSFISQQRRMAPSAPAALPIGHEDGSFGVALKGTPEFTVAQQQVQSAIVAPEAAAVAPPAVQPTADTIPIVQAAPAPVSQAGAAIPQFTQDLNASQPEQVAGEAPAPQAPETLALPQAAPAGAPVVQQPAVAQQGATEGAVPAVDTTPGIVQAAPVDVAAAEAATSPKNDRPEPTEGQREAGNYAKGHTSVGGLDVTIENEAGTRRRPEWPPLAGHYGYVKRTTGADGDQVDVFIKPGTPEDYDGPVFVIDQMVGGKFDEHKAMIGHPNQPAAAKAYRDSYTKGWKGLGKVRRMTMAEFKDWLKNGDTTKPAAVESDSTAKAEAKPERPAAFSRRVAEPDDAAQNDAYETDLFGDPVPAARGKGRKAQSDLSAVSGNVQPASAIRDTKAPGGQYLVRTVVGAEVQRKLGAATITTPQEAAQATQYLYRNAVERFDGIVTDKNGKPLAVVGGFKGALGEAAVYPATLVGEAVRIRGAANIWFSHNHPSGTAQLSNADRALNSALANAFRGSGIEPAGLLAVADGRYAFEGVRSGFGLPPGEYGEIGASGSQANVPVIDRVLEPSGAARPEITSTDVARRVASDYYALAKVPGLVLLDSQYRVSAWVPLAPKMLGTLRGTGGLNAIYRAVSESNAGGAIIVHGGELDALEKMPRGVTVAQNIAAALAQVDVQTLDAINARTGVSLAERGAQLQAGPVFSRAEGSDGATTQVDSHANPAAVGAGRSENRNLGVQPGRTAADAGGKSAGRGVSESEARGSAGQDAAAVLSARGMAAPAVSKIANAIRSAWANGPEVVVVANMTDAKIPQRVRDADAEQRSGGASGDPEGFFVDGRVFLVASALNSDADVARVLAHESLGHYGLRGLYGERLKPILEQIANVRRAEVAKKAREYGLDPANRDHQLIAAEEILAVMAQSNPQLGFVRKAIAAIRQWLREAGLKIAVTDADIIAQFILPARAFVERGAESAQVGDAVMASRSPRRMTEEQARAAGFTLKAYRGVSKSDPFNASGSTWATTSREVAEVYAEEVMGYDDPGVVEVMVNPTGLPRHDASRLTDEQRETLGADSFGNPQAPGIYDRSDDHPLGGSRRNVTVIHAPNEAVAVIEGTTFSRAPQTDSKAFRDWFGASKVVDADGKPLVVYHGTRTKGEAIDAFDLGKTGRQTDAGWMGRGFYFGDSETANAYAGHYEFDPDHFPQGGAVYPAYLALKNPAILSDSERNDGPRMLARELVDLPDSASAQEVRDALIEAGYDGVIYQRAPGRGYREYVAFHPEQVKSATGNRGTFDTTNPDIRFSRAADAVKKAAADGARAIKGATLQSTWKRLHNAWVDKRPLSIQLLGRRQIVEVYEKLLPELRAYSNEMQQYDADKNESAAAADEIVTRWRRLKDADQLAEVMHGATLNEYDPDRSKTPRDLLTPEMREVHDGWQALSPEAQAVYREARDAYETHWNLVKKAIGERIERADISENDRRAMMEQYRDEFLKPIEGVYFPLARFGDYVITVKKDGVTQAVVFAETLTEAEAEQARLTKDFPDADVGKVTKRKEFNAARDSVSKDFVRKLYETVDREAGPDSEALKDAINQLYLTSLPDVSWAKHGIHRKGTPGYNKDARRAFAANMFHGGYHVAKLRHADVLQDYLRAMQERVDGNREEAGYDSVAAQQVVDEMVKRHDATINPDNNPAANTATALGFVWYLGASPASALVNLSQTALVAYPIIGAKFGFGKSQAALLKASSEAVKFRNDFRGKLAGDENEAIERAIREGLVDITQAHDLASISEGRDSQLHGALSPVMRVASKLFHEAEKFNRQATFLAAYRLAKGAGESAESAYDTARDLTYRGHFDYAQSNRPRVMMGPVARVILLFKQYGQNMIYTLGRNAVLAAKGDRQALRTLSGILVAHGLAAGTLGLPMSSILFGLASLLGGSDDEPWDAEVAYRNYLADALGPTLGEIVARGVFRGIFPGDVSARVGLDSLLVRDIDLTLSPGKVHQEILNAILGPVAGIGVNMARGAADLARGDVQRGVEAMLPKAIADGLKTVRYGMEGVKDRTGVDVLSEVKAHELAAQVLGFSPARAKEAYEGRRAALGKEEALKARHNELLADFARALTTNDDEARAETIDKIRRFNESNPTFAITRDGIKRSVQNRLRRQVEAQNGVYLPRKHRDLADEGRFANTQ